MELVFCVALLGITGLGYAMTRAPREPAPNTKPPEPTTATSVASVPEAEIAKISYGEDGDDGDLDVTKVGPGDAPPSTKNRPVYQPPVTHLAFDDGATADGATSEAEAPLFFVHATAQTDKGKRRKANEDSLLVLLDEHLFVVADGMGGYRGGEIASQLAIETMKHAATEKQYDGTPHKDLPVDASELARAIQMANAAIQEAGASKPELKDMGTTVCALKLLPHKRRVHLGHVGDSRCYRLRDGVFGTMTSDHTMADHGVTGPESANLSRAVGIWPTMPIDVISGIPRVGDVYLLCSDGLTKMLSDDVIANVLRSEDDPKAAVERLVLFANERGGKDNITVILVRIVAGKTRPANLKQTLIGV